MASRIVDCRQHVRPDAPLMKRTSCGVVPQHDSATRTIGTDIAIESGTRAPQMLTAAIQRGGCGPLSQKIKEGNRYVDAALS